MGNLLAPALLIVLGGAVTSLLLVLPVAVAAESLAGLGARVQRRFWLIVCALPALGGLLLMGLALLSLTGGPGADPHQERIRPHLCLLTRTQLPDASFRFTLYGIIAVGLLVFALVRGLLSLQATARAERLLAKVCSEGQTSLCLPSATPQCFTLGLTRPVLVTTEGLHELLSPEELQAVLAHEACHQRHHDTLVELALRLATDPFIWLPTTHLYLRAARRSRELACDEAAAVAVGTKACQQALEKLEQAGRQRHEQAQGDLADLQPPFPDYASPADRWQALQHREFSSLALPLGVLLTLQAGVVGLALLWLWRPLHDTLYCLAASLLAVYRPG